ncbi:MAG TPA: electron transfer flavoprotein subunit beta/FixA family protein [Nocardioidaceae bacterium]|nr:electron transfer flavoprotein subunit beta/FixA family protein [Nocardioidaceae bacterium]
MKIVVCVKFVPDSTAARTFAPDRTVDRAGVDGLLSELDENAVEQALQIAADGDTEVTLLTVGPQEARAAITKGLQMGADAGVHVVDDAIHGADALGTSAILAAALGRLEHDIVLCGMASTDGGMSVVPAMLAERLGLPQLTFAAEVTIDGDTVRIRRDGEAATEVAEAALPVVLSVTDQANEPRYPSFKGIMGAKKKPVQTWSLADLGLSADEVGGVAAWTTVDEIEARPPRSAGKVVVDDGTAADQLVDFLAEQKFV